MPAQHVPEHRTEGTGRPQVPTAQRARENHERAQGCLPQDSSARVLGELRIAPEGGQGGVCHRLLGVKPVSINSGIFGWADRKRLYWAAGPQGEDVGWNDRALPENVTMTWETDRSVIHYGGKPIPRHIGTNDGYTWRSKNQGWLSRMVARVRCSRSPGNSTTPTMATAKSGKLSNVGSTMRRDSQWALTPRGIVLEGPRITTNSNSNNDDDNDDGNDGNNVYHQ